MWGEFKLPTFYYVKERKVLKMIDYNVRLNTSAPGTQALIFARQGENNTSRICVHIFRDTTPVDIPDNYVTVLRAVKPDGYSIYKTCERQGNTILIPIDGNMAAASGHYDCTITGYSSDGQVMFTPRFTIYVEEASIPDADIISTDDFSALAEAMTKAERYENAWSNPEVTVKNGEEPSGTVTIKGGKVVFDITVQKGDTGDPAYIGEESGCLVETADDGILRAGRKIKVDTKAVEDVSGLRPGDIYVRILNG